MSKILTINYDPKSVENLSSDSRISKEVDGLIADLSFSGSKKVTVSQWNYVNEFIYRFVKGEIKKEQLVFVHNDMVVEYDDLGFFVNEPGSFQSPNVSLVTKLNELRINKINI